jgi:hypothetical protein
MYDVGKNLKGKCKGVDLQQIGIGSGKHFLKFEIHYNKPHKYLNNGRILRLREVFTQRMQERFKEEIRAYYGQLKRDYVINPPNDRRAFDTSTILALCCVEKAVNSGQSQLETQREIYDKINQTAVFTDGDKINRRRGVKKVFDKLVGDITDRWDLSGIINEKLVQEEIITL